MKYTESVTINAPLSETWQKFIAEDFVKEWQPTMRSMKVISGEPGMVGSKSELVHEDRGREIIMMEEILEREEEKKMVMSYTTEGVENYMENHFSEEDGKTTWKTVNEFKFTSLMMKLMGFFGGFLFKGQTKKNMQAFKDAVEKSAN